MEITKWVFNTFSQDFYWDFRLKNTVKNPCHFIYIFSWQKWVKNLRCFQKILKSQWQWKNSEYRPWISLTHLYHCLCIIASALLFARVQLPEMASPNIWSAGYVSVPQFWYRCILWYPEIHKLMMTSWKLIIELGAALVNWWAWAKITQDCIWLSMYQGTYPCHSFSTNGFSGTQKYRN